MIKKGLSECYECVPKPPPKQYAVCTIRNTPTQPIHCIVWAKFLFNQLFGVPDDENDVTPDTKDPSAAVDDVAVDATSRTNNSPRKNMRTLAEEHSYDPTWMFNRLFCEDVETLLTMKSLWSKRTPPRPLHTGSLAEGVGVQEDAGLLPDQCVWSEAACETKFFASVTACAIRQADSGGELVWDKDDDDAMDFVAAASNLRAYVFGIETKSRFDIKSMAGKIVPAIATTNAAVAGLIVLEALHILDGRVAECKNVHLLRKPGSMNKLVIPSHLVKPNPKCFACMEKKEITIKIDTKVQTVSFLVNTVLKGRLSMVAPDVMLGAVVLVSSDEDDAEGQKKLHAKTLAAAGIVHGTVLACEDFLQDFEFRLTVEDLDRGSLEGYAAASGFVIVDDAGQMKADPSTLVSLPTKRLRNDDACEAVVKRPREN